MAMKQLRTLPFQHRVPVGLVGIYLFIYVFAVPMLVFDLVPSWGTWMGGFLLILQGLTLGWWLALGAGWRGVVAALLIGGGGWLVEHIGVTTGWPFGAYTYTSTLGLKLGGSVPLPIPFAWLLVVPASLAVARRFVGGVIQLPCTAGLALLLDLQIEPVAAYVVNYWQWLDSGPYYGVPTSNFIAWGGTALLLATGTWLLTRHITRWPLSWLPELLYSLNLVQFTVVAASYGYRVTALIGASALLGLALLYRLPSRLSAKWSHVAG